MDQEPRLSSLPKPKPFATHMLKLYGCIAVATLNSIVYGYDGSLMSSINSYPQYREYFHFGRTGGTPATGIVFGLYPIGVIVGSFFSGPISDYVGRRFAIMISAVVIIVGAIISATCQNLSAFMAGRFILAFGAAINFAAACAYLSELAYPTQRGASISLYMVVYFFGSIPASFICWRTSSIQGTISWRLPIWLQVIVPTAVLVLSWAIPESPRWLISRGRDPEALEVLAKYYGDGNINAVVVQLEYKEMLAQIARDASDKRWWDYREFVNTSAARYRSVLVILLSLFNSFSGEVAMSYYYPQFLQAAGLTNLNEELLLRGMSGVVSFAGTVIGSFLTNHIRRRTQMLTATSITLILWVLIITLNAINVVQSPEGPVVKSRSISLGQLSLLFIFTFVFCAGWTPIQVVYPLECLPYETRAKGMAMYLLLNNLGQFYNTFVTGIAITNIQWKYYLFFLCVVLSELILVYFFFPETGKFRLEELARIFQSDHPVKASLEHEVTRNDAEASEMSQKDG